MSQTPNSITFQRDLFLQYGLELEKFIICKNDQEKLVAEMVEKLLANGEFEKNLFEKLIENVEEINTQTLYQPEMKLSQEISSWTSNSALVNILKLNLNILKKLKNPKKIKRQIKTSIEPIEIISLSSKEPLLNSPQQLQYQNYDNYPNLTIEPIKTFELHISTKCDTNIQNGQIATNFNNSNMMKKVYHSMSYFLQNYHTLINRQNYIKEMKQQCMQKLMQSRKIQKDIENFIGCTLFKRQQMIKNLVDRASPQFEQINKDETVQQEAYRKICKENEKLQCECDYYDKQWCQLSNELSYLVAQSSNTTK